MPAATNNPSGGSRQQKAAQLRAQAEASTASSTLPGGAAASVPAVQTQSDTPTVGQGDHVVTPGECISSIARDMGHLWETIWNDAANSELKSVRKDANVLLPGDHVSIPEVHPKKEPGATEMRHRFVRKGEPAYLPLQILYNDKPMANEPYELQVDGQTFNGTTDPQGKLEVRIPGNARRATLIVGTEPRQHRYELDLGAVDPIESMSGVQQRLRNLGYKGVPVNGVCETQTEQALQAYQKANDLPETGQADSQTRQKLKYKHGS